MLALVSRDRLQLPCASADAGSGSRASLVDTADRLVKFLNPGLEFAPHTFLIMQQSNLLAVACPLLGRALECRAFSYAKWSSLSDLAGAVVYTPVASAFARVAAYCRHGVPIPDVTVRDGARAAKRVLTLPWTPSAVPAAWPLQLQYLTAVDTLFRRRLAATPKTHPHYAYLVDRARCEFASSTHSGGKGRTRTRLRQIARTRTRTNSNSKNSRRNVGELAGEFSRVELTKSVQCARRK